jgi:hypothetical protein
MKSKISKIPEIFGEGGQMGSRLRGEGTHRRHLVQLFASGYELRLLRGLGQGRTANAHFEWHPKDNQTRIYVAMREKSGRGVDRSLQLSSEVGRVGEGRGPVRRKESKSSTSCGTYVVT